MSKKKIDKTLNKALLKLDQSNVDKTINRIFTTENSLLSKETLLNDLYRDYKETIIGDRTLNKEKRKLQHKIEQQRKSKKKQIKQSSIEGVYYNSLKKMYSVLIKVDGPIQQHYGYFKSLKKAEEKCIEIKQQLGLK